MRGVDEAAWLSGTYPGELLRGLWHVEPFVGGRKLRLFSCACVRRIWPLLHDASRRAVEYIERLVDLPGWDADDANELYPDREMLAARAGDSDPDDLENSEGGLPYARSEAAQAAYWACDDIVDEVHDAREVCDHASIAAAYAAVPDADDRNDALFGEHRVREGSAQVHLLREIIGNPFRPVALAPELLTANAGLAVALARTIYDERAFERLPILGDALEDAGCADATILDHCRGPNCHVRGCWLLDLILGLT